MRRRLAPTFIIASMVASLSLAACATGANAPGNKNPQVVLSTNHGDIVIEVFADKAPISAKNFLDYVDRGFYDGLIFHRVIPGFMLQGGGFSQDLQLKTPGPMIQNEANNGLKNKRGTLAMARTGDPNSATSQFFINLVDNAYLDHTGMSPRQMGYCVFARVISGMEVADAIAKSKTYCPSKSRGDCPPTIPRGMGDVPAEAVIITHAKRQ